MDNMTGLAGVEVGRDRFTDLDYADNQCCVKYMQFVFEIQITNT